MDVMFLTLMVSLLMFVCILNYHLSAGVQVSLIDNSISKTCQKGLWADRDWLNLTMIVDTKGEVITPRSVMTVSFRERERIGKREIEVCSFVYKTECLVKKIHGCFCYETNGEKYYIQYIEIAKLQYSRNYVIFNNGKPNETMILPPIVNVIQYIITVKTTTTAIFNSTVPYIETPQTEATRSAFSVASILLALIVLAVCSFGLYYYYTHYYDSGTQGEDENQVKETELDKTDAETSGNTTDIVSVKSKIEPF
ncbi:uncharacterized protein LOC106058413 isoform X3 [Biomphalaria glabrata]|uniref:Uncharacterized protein LOC106058413 isoform X3 n=1 Tax=Biomphalaria glabrata TaxID=6526 RepID=A0A9U8E3K7_BIOGL|nr:uncharacterized protein LOC106058413 isoform X3 [Biomphalaria glabrata]